MDERDGKGMEQTEETKITKGIQYSFGRETIDTHVRIVWITVSFNTSIMASICFVLRLHAKGERKKGYNFTEIQDSSHVRSVEIFA